MNVQAQMSGQISGQVSNQLSQQNGNNLPNSIFGIHPAARIFIREQIFGIILQHQPHPIGEPQKQRYKDLARRLEDCLFRAAQTKEDYININTLNSRLRDLLKHAPANNNDQRNLQLVNPSSSIGI